MEDALIYKKDGKEYSYKFIITVSDSNSYHAAYVRYDEIAKTYNFHDYLFKVYGRSYEDVMDNLNQAYGDYTFGGDIKGNVWNTTPESEIDKEIENWRQEYWNEKYSKEYDEYLKIQTNNKLRQNCAK